MPRPLYDAYIAFCVVFVTVTIAMGFGAFMLGFTQRLVKEIKYWRQTRRNGQRLQDEIGRIDEVLEDEHELHSTGVFLSSAMPISMYHDRQYLPHFEVLADGTIIENFPKGVPAVDNRNPKR